MAFSLGTINRPWAVPRGNYAINGGTHSIKFQPQSTTQSRGESMEIVLDHEQKRFAAIGTGVAGINHSFRLTDFVNGQSALVAVDEIRAGVHPLDLRGVWALGQVGSSITWAHGVVGDDCGPNNQWERSDDIQDAGRLHKAVGSDRLEELRMPCAWYVDRSQEMTARSLHPGGVHVLFLDGAVRFVPDEVDRGLWHVIHSRQTPLDAIDDIELALAENHPPADAVLLCQLISWRSQSCASSPTRLGSVSRQFQQAHSRWECRTSAMTPRSARNALRTRFTSPATSGCRNEK